MQLSKHFQLHEFEKSSTATRLNIKNKAGIKVIVLPETVKAVVGAWITPFKETNI